MNKLFDLLKRCKYDLMWLIGIFLFILFLPAEYLDVDSMNPKFGLLATVLTKGLYVTCGFLHAHINRKTYFYYINFGSEKEWSNNLIIIVIYAVTIYSWAHGG